MGERTGRGDGESGTATLAGFVLLLLQIDTTSKGGGERERDRQIDRSKGRERERERERREEGRERGEREGVIRLAINYRKI